METDPDFSNRQTERGARDGRKAPGNRFSGANEHLRSIVSAFLLLEKHHPPRVTDESGKYGELVFFGCDRKLWAGHLPFPNFPNDHENDGRSYGEFCGNGSSDSYMVHKEANRADERESEREEEEKE